MLIEATSARAHETAVLWEASDGSLDNRITAHLVNGVLKLTATASGSEVAALTLGRWVPLSSGRVALAYTTAGLAASYNGQPAVTAAASMPTGLDTVRLGSGADGYWNATIARVTGYAAALSGAALASLTAIGMFWDDFGRDDGALVGPRQATSIRRSWRLAAAPSLGGSARSTATSSSCPTRAPTSALA